MKGMLATLLGAFLLGYAVTGCIDEKDHYKPDDKTSGVPNSFDFATTQDVQLDLKYDVPVKDYQVLFELYFENPLTTDAEGQVVKRTDITPKVVRMTDGTGKYPSIFSTARIGCPAATVPISGTFTTSRRTRLKLSSIISIALGLVASRRM